MEGTLVDLGDKLQVRDTQMGQTSSRSRLFVYVIVRDTAHNTTAKLTLIDLTCSEVSEAIDQQGVHSCVSIHACDIRAYGRYGDKSVAVAC